MNYYEHHIGDYAQATAHLSMLEDAVYSRMLRWYYAEERPLPGSLAAVCRIVRAVTKPERDAVESVLADFFTLTDDGYRQKRCDAEIAHFKDKQSKAKRSAIGRWEAERAQRERTADAMRTHTERTADAEPTQSERTADAERRQCSPDTRHQTPINPPLDSPPADPPSDPPLPAIAGPPKGTRIPSDFHPGESGMAFAEKQGLANGIALSELDQFRDHWRAKTGKDGTALDWQARWRTWCRNAAKFRAVRGPNEPQWRREQRERNEAVLGPYAKRQTIDMEASDGAPKQLG